jgi:hypothetical protein
MPKDVLYLVSLFPCWSETFILRELQALDEAGVRARIASLKNPSETLVHPSAEALCDRVIYPSSPAAALSRAFAVTARRPGQSLAWFLRVGKGLWRHPVHMFKSWWTISTRPRKPGSPRNSGRR